MSTILDEIIEHKRREVATARTRRPFADVEASARQADSPRGFLRALRTACETRSSPALIAEVKKASPSAGLIRADFDPVRIAKTYESAGAHCLSVLTDEKFFQGHLDFLQAVRREVTIPVMRKEFIIDRYQIAEARAAGADCVLLIAECLNDTELRDLYGYARDLGMDALIELYDANNVDRVVATGSELIGINNRDLRSFHTTLEHTFTLRPRIPSNVLVVSESGIRTHEDILRLHAANLGAVLVGETLMKEPDIAQAVKQLMAKDQ